MPALFYCAFFSRLFCFLLLPEAALADVVQPNDVMKVRLGDSVTLTCFSQNKDKAWYKQPFGQKPRLVAQVLGYSPDGQFEEEFRKTARFSLQQSESSFNLTISKTEPSDSAAYYCVTVLFKEVTFGDGTVLILTDSKSRAVAQQPVSDPVNPGDSVSVQCTVEGETCAGEHSVYWFRHGSGESLPGLIYTHGKRSDECEKSPETGSPTRSCVYSLPKRNLSRSDAGTYYCAVVTCGNILFGNGTKINMEAGPCNQTFPVLLGLAAAFALSVLANIALVWTRKKKTTCETHEGHGGHQSQCDILTVGGSSAQDEDTLNYAALNLKNSKPKRKKRETKQDTIYSDLRIPNWE